MLLLACWLQLEHTTLPKREQGHKQLGKQHAASHLLQVRWRAHRSHLSTALWGAALAQLSRLLIKRPPPLPTLLLQLLLMFALGGMLLMLPHPAPGQGRVVMGTFGVIYAMQVTLTPATNLASSRRPASSSRCLHVVCGAVQLLLPAPPPLPPPWPRPAGHQADHGSHVQGAV